jgi:hypothetical protein
MPLTKRMKIIVTNAARHKCGNDRGFLDQRCGSAVTGMCEVGAGLRTDLHFLRVASIPGVNAMVSFQTCRISPMPSKGQIFLWPQLAVRPDSLCRCFPCALLPSVVAQPLPRAILADGAGPWRDDRGPHVTEFSRLLMREFRRGFPRVTCPQYSGRRKSCLQCHRSSHPSIHLRLWLRTSQPAGA